MRCLISTILLWSGLSGLGPVNAAPEREEAEAILNASGIRGGLLVHLNCGDGRLTAALRTSERWLVHGLDRDAANVEKARRHVAALGLYGKVAIDQIAGETLPYADSLVNLLVASDLDVGKGDTIRTVSPFLGIPMTEVMRVLSPGGAVCLRKEKAWIATVKPRPAEIDEWTHFLHGPDNNAVARDTVVGPPRHLQWVGGPRWARSHEYTASVSAAVSASGRVFYIADEGPTASVAAPPAWSLIARDAFSGVLLWKRPIPEWQGHLGSFHDGLADLARRLVAVGDRVYVPLGIGEPLSALDAATGETVRVYEGTDGARDLVVAGATLYVIAGDAEDQRRIARRAYSNVKIVPRDLVAIEAETGRKIWDVTDKFVPATLAVSGGRVFFQNPQEVVCLEAKSGRRLWGAPRPGPSERVTGDASPTLVVADGVVLTAEGSWGAGQLAAFSAETGKQLWTCPAKQPLSQAVDVFVIDGQVWTGMWATARNSLPRPLDLLTGAPGKAPAGSLAFIGEQPSGHHHRCYRNKATVRYLLTARRGVEFIDIASGTGFAHNGFRGTCQYGVMPANGLLYLPPNSCACYIQANVPGFKAMAGGSGLRGTGPAAERLERGPAYGQRYLVPFPPPEKVPGTLPAGESDWPTYRGDTFRSGRSRGALPTELRQAWETDLGGRLSPPTVCAGRAFVASLDTHTVYALNAADGRRLWDVAVGGRVDGPPTICGDAVLFGSADGWVYCLRAADGALAWRFRAAPEDRRMVAWDQVESVWPVHGSVLVTPGQSGSGPVVWAAAGRSSYLSGGIRLCRLDAATGRLLSETRLDTTGPDVDNLPVGKFTGPGWEEACLPDVLSADGSSVFMRHVRFNLAGERQVEKRIDPGVRHLFSSIGFLDDSWWHRAYWVLGPKMWIGDAGLSGWNLEALTRPFGRILAVDETHVYGFGRDDLGGGYSGGHVGLTTDRRRPSHYRLFAAAHDPPQTAPAAAESPGQEERVRWSARWARSVPLLVRAITVTDERLFVAGPPDSGDVSELADALAGKRGGLLMAVATADGGTLGELPLDAPPVFDGIAAGGGRLYLSSTDGRLRCLAAR